MNNLYRLLRYTVMLAVMMTIPAVMRGALPDTTTVLGTHLYKINLAKNTTGYQSVYFITPSSPNVSIKDNPGASELWYILETDDTPTGTFERPHIEHYCYIVNAVSGQYLYYTGTNTNSIQTDVVEMRDIDANGVENDRFKFIIKKSGNGSTENYCLYPKIAAENNKSNNNSSNLWESNSYGYLSLGVPHGSTYANGLTLSKERNGEWTSQWVFVSSSLLAAPTITFDSGTNSFSISHDILSSGCTIYYTIEGSTPSTASTPYTGPVIVNASETVKAVVIRDYDNILLTEVGSLEVAPVAVAAPTVTNNFDGNISLSTTTPNAIIYYTTDGTTPSSSNGTLYASAFSLGNATVIKAITYNSDLSESSTVTIYDVPQYDAPIISFNSSTSQVTINPGSGGTAYYTTNGSTPTTSSTQYSTPITVSSDATIKAIATHAGYLNSDVATWSNDYSQHYLTFRVLTNGTIGWKAYGNLTKSIQYSINNGAWTTWTSTSEGEFISVQAGNLVRLRGTAYPYATSKSAYSGFEGGTATYDIEGNIHSLIYGDNFAGTTTMPNNSYMFCSLFKKSNAISAENLILPATSLRTYCYRALFSYATSLEKPCALPATTLATGCYWYMFEQSAITTAPELNATTLVQECYGHMFEGCSNLNYIKCFATSGFDASKCLENWALNVASTGVFVKKSNITDWPTLSASGIPEHWTVYDEFLLYSPEISCNGEYITITCATEGASIYYRLNQTGDFSLYTDQISVSTNTTVEAYSTKGNNTSNTVIITFEIYDNPFDESNRSIDSWTYGGTQVTLPYSVNGIDGHSSHYSTGTHTFETTITLYKEQPTYLWFQHADQSADIYVDNEKVTTHWGGYNAFFVDITDYVHIGTNRIKVVLNNTTRNTLAPCAGDFNFNATLGKVKLFTSPLLPSMDYGYDGFHITSSVTDASATINIKTSIPVGASVICKIDAEDGSYHFTDTIPSTGEEMTFTTTISNPHLWNGIEDPFLYNVILEIYHNNELYHRYERPYGFRYYEYVINKPVAGVNYTGFLLNGSPYLLRGVCMHDDIEGKANALNDDDYTQEFAIIQELGCNFIRLAHYPHPKEVYDWCDRLGIIVQTEVPCVNKLQSTLPQDYYDHLYIQYKDMVRQHFNHPCIVFWGLSNETTTDDKEFGKTIIEAYTSFIKGLDSERLVGYVMSHSVNDPSGYYNNPDVDWFGCNIYVGWYIEQNSNNPSTQLNTRLNNTLTREGKPLAFSEYGGGGTPSCHSGDFMTTTTRGNNPRHDIEYQMWLHEGHIAAINDHPELLFTSQWQLFDIAVYNRVEGYKVCPDGETVFDNYALQRLNNKGLVERDHRTKKDTYYLYKAWWNPSDKFVHICGKDYERLIDRVIKCYTNDGDALSLYVNNTFIETVDVTDNIATFAARTFEPGDVIRVEGATSNDTFTFTNDRTAVFTQNGDWNIVSKWSNNVVPTVGSDVVIAANATIPANYVAHVGEISINSGKTLTIADGGQLLHSNEHVTATVQKSISAYTVASGQGLTDGWYFIASPISTALDPDDVTNMLSNTYDLYRLNNTIWENFRNHDDHPDFTTLNNGAGYLYANSNQVTLQFTGELKPYAASESVPVSAGWNLVGNPFAFNVYANQPYYKMNSTMTGIEAVDSYTTTTIAPCTGIIIDAAEAGNVTFSREAPVVSSGNNGGVYIALSQPVPELVPELVEGREGPDRNQVGVSTGSTTLALDNVIVSFNEGSVLPKFRFGNNAEIYLPQGNEDYAIAFSDKQGEMPLSFKAKENGSYTLTVNPENVEMAYLHLIDNMTGADIDLLSTPSYTFTANTTDYESRFRLVFSANETNGPSTGSGSFAFFSNGSWIIANEGQATLQVIDLTGRILSNETINGSVSKAIQAVPGIYVLRLINGNDVMTQKIVVR